MRVTTVSSYLLLLFSACSIQLADGQQVITRILPSDQIVLQEGDPNAAEGQGSRSSARTVFWCLVQDLEQEHSILSLELLFQLAPQVRSQTEQKEEKEGEEAEQEAADREDEEESEEREEVKDLMMGSFSQLGVPGLEAHSGPQNGSASSSGLNQLLGLNRGGPLRQAGFPDALMNKINSSVPDAIGGAGLNGTGMNTDTLQLLNSGAQDATVHLDGSSPWPGHVTVARVVGSGYAQLGVQHVQRSGVSVRGTISAANPNLSSLQVSMQSASCSDCGTYTCVLRYHGDQGNITEARSQTDFIVAQSVTHRMNVKIRPSSASSWNAKTSLPRETASSETAATPALGEVLHNDSQSSARLSVYTDLLCVGTVSRPSVTFSWRLRRHSAHDVTSTRSQGLPEATHHGQPVLGRRCQYWTTSAVRHAWDTSMEWVTFSCVQGETLAATAVVSLQGPIVTASCGDSHSTQPLKQNDVNVTVVCDVSTRLNVMALSWRHAGLERGRCDVIQDPTNQHNSWTCTTTEKRFSSRKHGTKFVLTLGRYDATEDQGQWACVVVLPFDPDLAAVCVLG